MVEWAFDMRVQRTLYCIALSYCFACSSSGPKPADEPAATGTAAAAAAAAPGSKPATAAPEAAEDVKPPDFADIERPAVPAELTEVGKSVAEKNWQSVLDGLTAKKNEIMRAPLDVKVRAYAMEALAYAAGADDATAEVSYRKVLSTMDGADKKLEKEIGRKAAGFDKRLEALTASYAEAMFFSGERAGRKALEMSVPGFDGLAEADKAKKHFDTTVKQWAMQREKAIARAAQHYEKISSLKSPPPAWKVAAAGRIAQMHAEFVTAIESIPPPESWKQEPTSQKAYEQYSASYKAALEPRLKAAKDAFQKCVQEASAAKRDDAFAKYCKGWLAKH